MIRALAIVALLAGVATANPDAARRKATPDKFAKAAGEAFQAALAADQANELRTALGLYRKAYAISPHPSTIFNIADVERRLGQLSDAMKSYETYLALAPTAADRAEIEALIDKLGRTPGTLILWTTAASDPEAMDLASAYVLIDGVIVRRPGAVPPPPPGEELRIELAVAPGEHVVDVITPLTYGTEECRIRPGEKTRCRLTAAPRIDGNAVVSASDRAFRFRRPSDHREVTHERLELAPGRHKLALEDRSFECRPVVLDIAGSNTISFVFVGSKQYDGLQRCRTLDLQQHRLVFDP